MPGHMRGSYPEALMQPVVGRPLLLIPIQELVHREAVLPTQGHRTSGLSCRIYMPPKISFHIKDA